MVLVPRAGDERTWSPPSYEWSPPTGTLRLCDRRRWVVRLCAVAAGREHAVRVEGGLEPVEHAQAGGAGLRPHVGRRVVDVGAVDGAPVAAQQAVAVVAELVGAVGGVRHAP